MEPLALTLNTNKRVLLTPSHGSLVLEIQQAQNWRDGHGWGVAEQVIFDSAAISALRDYLTTLAPALPRGKGGQRHATTTHAK